MTSLQKMDVSDATGVRRVEALQFPLQGSHLIEASAGTGKTWTIAALYVRLVLGHGGQPARLPAQILVLTYTRAAAQELRDRVRTRLAQAAAWFAQADDRNAAAEDPFLASLRQTYPADQWPACAHALDLAAQSMDEAAISTIHAWCERVLQQHAFGSGHLFEQELQQDLGGAIRQVAWDYWRAQVASLDAPALALVQALWQGPDDLVDLRDMLFGEEAPVLPAETAAQVCAAASGARDAQLRALKQPWVAGAGELAQWLAGVTPDLHGVRPADLRRWVGLVKTWADDPQQEELKLGVGWERLSPDGIAQCWSGAGPAPVHPLCVRLPQLQEALAALPTARAPLVRHAAQWMAARLHEQLALAAVRGFDGLLTDLARALDGAGGPVLAAALRAQYPVVLIDEFQDTDPVQYRILDRVWQVQANDPATLIVFIGDPKQSIYAFRGADVHAYLQAVRDCGGRVQTLGRNYRSSQAMVRAVNAFFMQGAGSPFITGVAGEQIDFHPVDAQGRAEHLQEAQAVPAALQGYWIEADTPGRPLTQARYCALAADACAARVAGLLADGPAIGFQGPEGFRRLRPADLAILVGRHKEAREIRRALREVGVRSVYLSERDSVYATPLVAELHACLLACAQPDDERAVRAALATPLLDQDLATLDALVEDEQAWEDCLERFGAYHRAWVQRGVLPMLRQMLNEFGVPARLLADGREGERRLTDCLHLAELLQEASGRLDGEQALLAYLREQQGSDADDDTRHLRLESDEDLVRVVTVHKSKGLEYPCVFLPFACLPPPRASRRRGPQRLHQAGGATWVVDVDGQTEARLTQETLGEEVRKLYVALTRAQHSVWLGLAPLARVAESGLAHVLGADLQAAWTRLAELAAGSVAWVDPDPPGAAPVARPEAAPALGPARVLAAPVVRHPWWIASYSALHRVQAALSPMGGAPAPDSATEDVLREAREVLPVPVASAQALASAASADSPALTLLQGFPRGSEAGTFLHGLLEWAARRAFRDLDEARDLIARRCAVRGWQVHIELLSQWLRQFVATEWHPDLPGHPVLRLDQLEACLPELEFWLPAAQVSVTALDALISRHTLEGAARPPLAPTQMNGMFKGFIDLTLCAAGRYYLVDYKSNDLGDQPADYGPPALSSAMRAARYDVQMLLYVLALHRQLRARLPDYDYDRHMGGAVYLFLRGQEAPGQGLLSLRPPRKLVEALDALFRGKEGGDA